jgi:aryl-alcohol dehydrogenase-like predicted oxidoreductase
LHWNSTYTDTFEMLSFEYVDFRCWGSLCKEPSGGTWQSAWRQLEELVDQGKIRSLGESLAFQCRFVICKRGRRQYHSIRKRLTCNLIPMCRSSCHTIFHCTALLPAGISNVDVATLTELLEMARIQPSVVQCNSDVLRPNMGILDFCAAKGVQFQVQEHTLLEGFNLQIKILP